MDSSIHGSFEALQAQGYIDSKKVATIKIMLVQFFGACIAAVLMTAVFAIWLDKNLHVNSFQIGELMALKTAVAIFYKPVFGYLLDKSQLRIWFIISLPIVALGAGPFLQFVYKPLILSGDPTSFYAAGLLGGAFFGYTVIAGQAAMFSYCGRYIEAHGGDVDKIGVSNHLGWFVMSFVMVILYTFNPMYSFYLSGIAALGMIISLLSLKVKPFDNIDTKTTSKKKLTFFDLKKLIVNPRFYVLAFFSTSVMVVVYSEASQMGRFALTFWPADQQMSGLRIDSYQNIPVAIIGIALMAYASPVIRKINASRSMLLLGAFYAMGFVILGIAAMLKAHMGPDHYIPALVVSILGKDWIAIVNPFAMVVTLSYVNVSFDKRMTGTAFLIGFHFVCNLLGSVGKVIYGDVVSVYGWTTTYLSLPVLICISLILTACFMHYSNVYDKRRVLKHLDTKE